MSPIELSWTAKKELVYFGIAQIHPDLVWFPNPLAAGNGLGEGRGCNALFYLWQPIWAGRFPVILTRPKDAKTFFCMKTETELNICNANVPDFVVGCFATISSDLILQKLRQFSFKYCHFRLHWQPECGCFPYHREQ